MRDAPDILYLTEREAPTEPGWYWARQKIGGQILPVRLAWGHDDLFVVHNDLHSHLSHYHWYGPLPEVRIASGG